MCVVMDATSHNMTGCNKCDNRGMVPDSPCSAHSCECGKDNRLMEEYFKGWTLGDLVAYKNRRLVEKGKI